MYISRTMLILSLDAFIEIATGRMSFIILGTALMLPLGVRVYISRAYSNIATGRSVCILIITIIR